jgi:hypothetical protein
MDDISISELRDELPWLEGTILAAMRTWVLGCKRGVPVEMPVQVAFANLRAPEAAEHLDRFMQALSKGCTRMIDIYCTCEPVVSADEALLLDVFAILQEGFSDTATGLLHGFVEPTTAHTASGDALVIVQVLKNAGHVIARGPAALQRHDGDNSFPVAGALIRLH